MNKLIYFIFISLLLASCASESGSGISGTAIGSEGETVVLYRFTNQKPIATDSATIASDGSFTINPSPALDLNYYLLSVDLDDTRTVRIMTDSSEVVNLNLNGDNWSKDWSVDGSKQTALLQEFGKTFNPLVEEYNELVVKLNTPGTLVEEVSHGKMRIKEITSEMNDFCTDFIDKHSNEPAAFDALSGLDMRTDIKYIEKLLSSTKNSFGENFQYKMVEQEVAKLKKKKIKKNPSTPGAKPSPNAAYSIGQAAPELKFNDPDGNSRALSDLKGKVVLIDFWASWCGPCRRENPNVVKAYDKYKSKGFDIFSVSLDKDMNKWKAAIAKDGLKWPNHVSDLKGWQSEASALYGVRSIPHTVLVGKDGNVIGANLRGPALERKLAEILGE